MKLVQQAVAGSLESSDAMITVGPGTGGIALELESAVGGRFGEQIRQLVQAELSRLGVTDATIAIRDMGALDVVLRARVQTAVFRAAGKAELNWEALS